MSGTGIASAGLPPTPPIPAIGSKAKGLAFDSADNLYISTESGKVVKLEGGVPSTFIPEGRGGLDFGKYIRFSQGHFYINNVLNAGTNPDTGSDEVLLFNQTGAFVRKLIIESKEDGSQGFHMKGMAVNVQGQLYMGGFGLSPLSTKEVVRVDANGQNFKVLPVVGERRVGAPTSLALDSMGNLYVGDFGMVSKFDANGTFLQNIVEKGVANSGFESATHLAVDQADNLYVGNLKGAGTATPAWNLLKFNSSGAFQGEFIPAGTGGLSPHPEDIGFDSQGFLYIADERVGGVIRFTPAGSFDRVVVENFGEGNQGGDGTGVGDKETALTTGVYSCWLWTLWLDPFSGLLIPWLEPSYMGVIEIQAGQRYRVSPIRDDSYAGTFQYDDVRGWVTFTGGGLHSRVAAFEDKFLRFRPDSPQNPGGGLGYLDHLCELGRG